MQPPTSPPAGIAIALDGRVLTLETLPSPDLTRWTPHRKAEILAAVSNGLLSAEGACRRYRISIDEFAIWQGLCDRYGLDGLRTTRIQRYRT